ncbi:MAG: ribosome recycling factor [Opitutales bacterium]|nr:ribosome recycling factor [Opitutales bacterium]
MNPEEVLKTLEKEMKKAVDHAAHEFSTLHTGKASPSMVENIQAEVYGSPMRIKDVAAITTPDARMILIQPWDQGAVKAVEQAIIVANIGLNPAVDGQKIRVPIPELSRERRESLVKNAHKMAEDGRIGVRAARHHAMDALKVAAKEGGISEDDQKRAEKEVQRRTDHYNQEIAKILDSKEKELMQV